MVEVTALKDAARGRWPEIIAAHTDIRADDTDGNHHPCPQCGGVDRFRAFDDFADTGAVYCNQCHSGKNGDGISTLQWALGIDFSAAVKLLADHLGMNGNGTNGKTATKPSNGKPKKGIDFKQIDESHLDDATIDKIFGQFCAVKPSITVAGITLPVASKICVIPTFRPSSPTIIARCLYATSPTGTAGSWPGLPAKLPFHNFFPEARGQDLAARLTLVGGFPPKKLNRLLSASSSRLRFTLGRQYNRLPNVSLLF